MRTAIIGILTATMAVVALSACDSTSAPPGTPDSGTFSMHGRVETTIGGSAR